MRLLHKLLWLAWPLTLLSCEAELPTATEVLVIVDGDRAVRERLSTLEVSVFDRDGEKPAGGSELDVSDSKSTKKGKFSYPVSFSLVPASAKAKSFRLVIRGLEGERELLESQHFLEFSADKRVQLVVYLYESCLGKLCRDGAGRRGHESCHAGECKPVVLRKLPVAGNGKLGSYDPREQQGSPASPAADGNDDAVPNSQLPQTECDRAEQCAKLVEGATPEGCAVAECVEGSCQVSARDGDLDRHGAKNCKLAGAKQPLGDDCDDGNPQVHPDGWDGPEHEGALSGCGDQLDNDCDGRIDNGVIAGKTCTCDENVDIDVPCSTTLQGKAIAWPALVPAGNCQYGKRSCKNGVWSDCVGAVEPEASDSCTPGDDADCDGNQNEGCDCAEGQERPCGPNAVGVCKPGKQTCIGGEWSTACVGAQQPLGPDTCDEGNDSNCNGRANEGCLCVNGRTETCGRALRALGVCADKRTTCVDGRWNDAACQRTSTREICSVDLKDEDCDGSVNEDCECLNGFGKRCGDSDPMLLGDCAEGEIECVDGRYTTCNVTRKSSDSCFLRGADETCDGVENGNCECVLGESRPCTAADGCAGKQDCSILGSGKFGECVADPGCTPPAPVM